MNCSTTRFARLASTAMLAAMVSLSGPAAAKTIKEAAEQAVNTHPEVGQARFNKRAIEQELRAARGGYLPSIDVRGAIGHEWRNDANTRAQRSPGESGWMDMNRYEAGVSLRQLIFDGFGTDSEVSRQFHRATTAQYRTADAAQVLALRAIEAYLEVQRTQRILEISNQNLRVHQDILNRVQARARGGRGPQSDVDQAQARLSDATGRVANAKKSWGDAIALYIQAVGEPPDALTDVSAPESEMPPSAEEAVTVAMDNAPAVRAATSDVRVAHAAMGVADSRFFPVVTAELDYNWSNSTDNWSSNTDVGFRGQSQRFTALLVGRWNIYRGGTDLARKRESTARLFEARETLERSRREVAQQTRVSFNAVHSSRERRAALLQQIAANERVRIAYSQQFDRGRRTLLDLLDIQNEIVNNQIDLATEEATVRFGIFRTLASMGRLLPVLGIAPPGEATTPPPRSLFHSLSDDLNPRREDLPWSTPADGARRHGAPPPPATPASESLPPAPPPSNPPAAAPPQGPTPLPGSAPRQ